MKYIKTYEDFSNESGYSTLTLDNISDNKIDKLMSDTPKEQRFELIKHILHVVKDRLLDYCSIGRLIEHAPKEQRFELVNQILHIVKDKIDFRVISTLMTFVPRGKASEFAIEILPLIDEDMLRTKNMISAIMWYIPKEQAYDVVKEIIPLVKYKLGHFEAYGLLKYYTSNEYKSEVQKLIDKCEITKE